jgi:hypothetical protein
MNPRRLSLVLLVLVLYVLHQDWWNWTTAHPLIAGFLPIGLFYHACYSLAAAILMGILVRYDWPSHLDPGAQSAVRNPESAIE